MKKGFLLPKNDAKTEKPKKTRPPEKTEKDDALQQPAVSSSAAAEVPKIYTQPEINHFVKQLEVMRRWGSDDFTYITESGEIFRKGDLEEIVRVWEGAPVGGPGIPGHGERPHASEAGSGEAENDPAKFGRLLNTAMRAGAAAGGVAGQGFSDTFLQDTQQTEATIDAQEEQDLMKELESQLYGCEMDISSQDAQPTQYDLPPADLQTEGELQHLPLWVFLTLFEARSSMDLFQSNRVFDTGSLHRHRYCVICEANRFEPPP
ncbi:unnamed protein product [Symbiodinium sp. CCMP2592]|nr:unnamed protein product [Symbiodinium sp. CCMP2592]